MVFPKGDSVLETLPTTSASPETTGSGPRPRTRNVSDYSPLITQQRESRLWREFAGTNRPSSNDDTPDNIPAPLPSSPTVDSYRNEVTPAQSPSQGREGGNGSFPDRTVSLSTLSERSLPTTPDRLSPTPDIYLMPGPIAESEAPPPVPPRSPDATSKRTSYAASASHTPVTHGPGPEVRDTDRASGIVPLLASTLAPSGNSTIDPQVFVAAQNLAAACTPLFQQALQAILDSRSSTVS
jgi:hypothetical protein